MTDDSGVFTDGTIVNEAFVDQIYDQVDDQCHSTTNPTVKPKATTDEVVAARGNLANLNARISGVVDADGNPVAAAGQATETQVARAEGNINLVSNADLEDWTAGTTSAPDDYTLSGTLAAILKTGAGEGDTTDLGTGTYAAKITSGAGAAAKLTQAIISTANYSKYRSVDGRKVGFSIRAKVANSSVLRIVIDDGVTTTASAYATGSANEQTLTAVHTISASATKLDVYAEVALGGNVAYVGGFTAVFSDLAPAAWTPGWAKFRQDILDEAEPSTGLANGITVKIGGVINSQVNAVADSSTAEADAHLYTLPANALAANGDRLIIEGRGTFTSSSNTKTLKFYFGGTALTLAANGAAAALEFSYRVQVTRVLVTGVTSYSNTIQGYISRASIGSLNFAATIAMKSTIQHATGGTVTEESFAVELHPAP